MVDFSFLINHFCVIGHRSVNVNQIFHYLRHILSLASVPFIPLNDLFIQISSLLTTNLHTLTRRNYSTYSSICNVSYAHTQRTACAATICFHGNTSTPPSVQTHLSASKNIRDIKYFKRCWFNFLSAERDPFMISSEEKNQLLHCSLSWVHFSCVRILPKQDGHYIVFHQISWLILHFSELHGSHVLVRSL